MNSRGAEEDNGKEDDQLKDTAVEQHKTEIQAAIAQTEAPHAPNGSSIEEDEEAIATPSTNDSDCQQEIMGSPLQNTEQQTRHSYEDSTGPVATHATIQTMPVSPAILDRNTWVQLSEAMPLEAFIQRLFDEVWVISGVYIKVTSSGRE